MHVFRTDNVIGYMFVDVDRQEIDSEKNVQTSVNINTISPSQGCTDMNDQHPPTSNDTLAFKPSTLIRLAPRMSALERVY